MSERSYSRGGGGGGGSSSGRGQHRGGRGDGGRSHPQEERRGAGRGSSGGGSSSGGGGGGSGKASSRRYDDYYYDDGYEEVAPRSAAPAKRESGAKRYSEARKADSNREATKRKEETPRYVDHRRESTSTPREDAVKENERHEERKKDHAKNTESGGGVKRSYQKSIRKGKEEVRGGGEGRDDVRKGGEMRKEGRDGGGGGGGKGTTDRELKPSASVKAAPDLETKWQKEEEAKERRFKAREDEKRRKEEEEAKRREEEERRKAEEESRREEEARRKEEEEARRIAEEKEREEREKREAEEREKKELEDYVSEMKGRLAEVSSTREANTSRVTEKRETFEENSAKLDSSLKKNSGFVKKLKTMTEAQRESIFKEIQGLNLTKYVGECAAAIVEAKIKMADLPMAKEVCCMLHQRYAEFPSMLLENWQKVLVTKKDIGKAGTSSNTSSGAKDAASAKLKIDVKFFADLITLGVLPEKEALPTLGNVLTCLVANDKEEHLNVTTVISFLKHNGQDYCGLLPRRMRVLSEKYQASFPRSEIFEENRQNAVRNLVRDYYASMVKRSLRENEDIRSMDKANRRTLQTKGEISQERKDKYEAVVTAFNKLWTNTQQLSELLDQPLPELPTIEIKDDFDVLEEINEDGRYAFEAGGLWEDEDTRQFYESLPDLKSLVPGILYKDSHQAEVSEAVEILEGEMATLEIEDIEMAEGEEAMEEDEAPETAEDAEEDLEAASKNPSLAAMEIQDETEESLDMGLTMKQMMEGFVASLPNCVNRELVDHTAKDFAMNMNTKMNRRRLVKALFTVPRTRLDLLPFYARLVATLDPLMPDVAAGLCNCLRADFKYHVKRKDQINLEAKNKSARFIGELVKFNLFPRADALNCLKMLLFDFRHHNIAMACALLECCGRFLFRNPDSHQRTKVYLETMMRKKLTMSVDSRYVTMIENAFYYCNPPEQEKLVVVERPPLHLYVRKLLFKDLNKLSVEKILKQIRKINWNDKEDSDYAVKCLVAAWNVKYNNVHCLANLLAGLSQYHDWVGIRVVDAVLEDVRVGMEMNQARFNQRRISMTKYVGELYNYRMVDSGVVFQTLYSFISFGVNTEATVDGTNLDPPEHLFRLRLACTLLDTCGRYFDRGSSKRKLDCYLKYLLRYYWFKKSWPLWDVNARPFPIDVEYMMQDAVDNLKPKYKMPTSFEEACENVAKMEEELRKKVSPLLKDKDQEMGQGGGDGAGLETIAEAEEDLKFDEEEEEDDEEDEERDKSPADEADGEEREGSQSQSQPDPSRGAAYEDDEEGTKENGEGGDDNYEDGGDDDVDDSDLSEDDDDNVVIKREAKPEPSAEDADFMAAFDKMMYESIQLRNQESVKPPQIDIAVPSNIKTQVLERKERQGSVGRTVPIPASFLKIPTPETTVASSASPSESTPSRSSEERGEMGLEVAENKREMGEENLEMEISEDEEEEEDDEVEEEVEEDDNGIDFILITRKGNKQNYHTLNVPLSVEFAAKLREREAAQREEKQRMKQLTLERFEQMEEEEMAMAKIGANQPGTNANAFRKTGYGGHGGYGRGGGGPKGAPDANLIFGVKPKYVHSKGVPDNVAEQFRSNPSAGGAYGAGAGGGGASTNPSYRLKR